MFEQQKIIETAQKVSEALRAYYDAVDSRNVADTSFRSMRPDRRYLRTQAVVAQVMQIVGPHLCEHGEHRGVKQVHDQLFATFYDAGVEVLTDQDRAILGLPSRDVRGWTAQEIQAYDLRMTQAMLSAPPPAIFAINATDPVSNPVTPSSET